MEDTNNAPVYKLRDSKLNDTTIFIGGAIVTLITYRFICDYIFEKYLEGNPKAGWILSGLLLFGLGLMYYSFTRSSK